jgi:hypothetical protein
MNVKKIFSRHEFDELQDAGDSEYAKNLYNPDNSVIAVCCLHSSPCRTHLPQTATQLRAGLIEISCYYQGIMHHPRYSNYIAIWSSAPGKSEDP